MQPLESNMYLAKNRVYEGDCIEIMRSWADNSFDHSIIDPPYNISNNNGLGWAFSSHVTMDEAWDNFTREEYLKFSALWLQEVCRLVRPNGNIFVFGSYHNIYDIGSLIHELGLKIINSIIWFKPNAQPNITRRMLTESTEQVIWVCNSPKEKATGWVFNYEVAKQLNNGKQLRNMWSIPYPSKNERRYGKHPSQKSLDFIIRLILIATNPGDLILDSFAGSGTTGVAAKGLNRNWVLIENNPEYLAIAKDRLHNENVSYPKELLQHRFDWKLSEDSDI
jgi:DNA modification methylase